MVKTVDLSQSVGRRLDDVIFKLFYIGTTITWSLKSAVARNPVEQHELAYEVTWMVSWNSL